MKEALTFIGTFIAGMWFCWLFIPTHKIEVQTVKVNVIADSKACEAKGGKLRAQLIEYVENQPMTYFDFSTPSYWLDCVIPEKTVSI